MLDEKVSIVVFARLDCPDTDLLGVYQHTSVTKLHSETAYFTHAFNALTISFVLHSGAEKERKTEGTHIISNGVKGLSYVQA